MPITPDSKYASVQCRINRELHKQVKRVGFETGMSITKLIEEGLRRVVEEYDKNKTLKIVR